VLNGYPVQLVKLLGRGEDNVTAAALTAERRVSPTTPGYQETGPYHVASTTHHELSFSDNLMESNHQVSRIVKRRARGVSHDDRTGRPDL
jgi:hypothetical protein